MRLMFPEPRGGGISWFVSSLLQPFTVPLQLHRAKLCSFLCHFTLERWFPFRSFLQVGSFLFLALCHFFIYPKNPVRTLCC